MKQCINCKEWIAKEHQFCPVCGESQASIKDSLSNGNNTSCFMTIIILLVLIIIGGVTYYMYTRGAFGEITDAPEIDTTQVVTDTELVEHGLPSELHLTSVNFLTNKTATIDLKISTNGNVSGKFSIEGVSGHKSLTGTGNKEDGVIEVNNTKEAISLILTPLVDNYGKYDCNWEYKGKAGSAYFYPEEDKNSNNTERDNDIPNFDPNKIRPINPNENGSTTNSADTTSASTQVVEKISSIKLSGKLNNRIQIEMNLYDLENGRGNYYYVSQGSHKLLSLDCHYNNNGTLTMIERDENGDVTGKFSGRLIDGTFTGIFENNKNETFSVVLHKK